MSFSQRAESLLKWGIVLAVLLRARSMVHAPVEWGVMDDPTWLQYFADHLKGPGFWCLLPDFLSKDLRWGLFRPTYFASAWLVYGWGGVRLGLPAWGAYLSCFLAFVGLAIGYGLLFVRWFPGAKLVVYVAFFLIFTPGLNLVNLVSLQERSVLIFGLAALWALEGGSRPRASAALWLGISLVCFVLALGAKSTAVAWAILLIARVWTLPRSSVQRVVASSFYGATAVVWALFVWSVARGGEYTARYQWSGDVLSRFVMSSGVWTGLVLTAILASVIVSALGASQRQASLGERLLPCSWAGAALGLLVLMLPWGVFGYYWTIFTPLVASCAAIVCNASVVRARPKAEGTLLVLLLAGVLFSLGPKLETLLQRPRATAQLVTWLRSSESSWAKQFVLPEACFEAAHTLPILAGRAPESFSLWSPAKEKLKAESAFLTWWECPLAPRQEQLGPDVKARLREDWGAWKVFELQRSAASREK